MSDEILEEKETKEEKKTIFKKRDKAEKPAAVKKSLTIGDRVNAAAARVSIKIADYSGKTTVPNDVINLLVSKGINKDYILSGSSKILK